MPRESYTDEERAKLTAVELAGLLELEAEPVDATTLDDQLRDETETAPAPAAPTAQTTEAAPVTPPELAAAPVAPPAAAATPSPGDAPPAPAAVVPAPATDPAPAGHQAALPTWTAPADAAQQLEQMRSTRLAIAQKFDDGDITAVEMSTQQATIDDSIAELRGQMLKADISTGSRLSAWDNDVQKFLAQPEHAHYRNGAPNAALDAEVRRLQTLPDAKPLDPAVLAQAHKNIQAAFGITTAPVVPTVVPPPPGQVLVPPTLRTLPSSDPTPANDTGEFAALDRLSGPAYDEAMSRLTPDQLNRYLAS